MLLVGLVGLPNAGKSSLFNLLTKRSVPAENFPFCTIDPHDGIVEVPDIRVKKLAEISNSQKEIYSAIEFRDIAGLVKNAHKGEGLGNQFLGHIQEVDLILLVVRSFVNPDIIHVENRVNPKEDEEILILELTLADQQKLEKQIPKLEKDAKTIPLAKQKLQIGNQILEKLKNMLPARDLILDINIDKEILNWRKSLNLLTDKPILKLANISADCENISYESDFNIDIKIEQEVSEMTKEERIELGLEQETGLDKMIRACYQKLDLCTYLTCGEKEARSWTFTKGMTAPQCAGKIHSDFEKHFIKAEVVKYPDFIRVTSWKNAFEQGLVKTNGKDYLFEDGDVVEFKIGKT
jgi:GTP-binding protein YchF